MRRYLLFALALMLGAAPALAQTPRISTGDRVRITQQSDRQVLIFRELVGDTVVLERQKLLTAMRVPIVSIDRFEVSKGHRPAGVRALRGAGIGLLSGAVIGGTIGLISGDDEGGFLAFTAEEKAGIAGVFFGAGGLVIGTIVGLAHNPEHWRRVPLDRLTVFREASGAVRVSIRI